MRKAFPALLLFTVSSVLLAQADDLVTRDGTVYHNYKVLSHDSGFLTILDSDGGGKIPLSNLPDDLQKKYGYNKQQADAAVQAAIDQDRKDREAIAQEQARRQQQLATQAQAQVQVQGQGQGESPGDPQAPAQVPASGGIAPVQAVSIQPTPSGNPAASTGNGSTVSKKPDASPAGILTQDEIDAINQKISDLKADIALEQRELEHEDDAEGTTHGAAAQIIDADKSKISDLNQQLVESNRAANRAHFSSVGN